MTATEHDWTRLCDEHSRVVAEYGHAQRRVSDLIAQQAHRIKTLEAQVMQLRAAAILRETALAWAREDMDALQASVPGLPRRLALTQHVRALEARIRALIRAQTMPATAHAGKTVNTANTLPVGPTSTGAHTPRDIERTEKVVLWVSRDDLTSRAPDRAIESAGVRLVRTDCSDAVRLDSGLADADLVICQVGCVSHGDWWRVKDYCTRTGKPCVLVDQPEALQRVVAAHADAGTTR
ncbi:DUF2325 domain-containing protein [Paraburkholderia sp. J67]|uniref:DUF2325 domain-containing protein n=1 Tax=Paraburkholderia sp. J67 TaxID=2805435 RepID=UPI002ABD1867|nr:DUF2325 domain-containing protein [Paraburkholderia sp. J67]